MKRLFFILSAVLLFSCTPENNPTPKSGPITFSIPYGDSINFEENFDTIVVSGLSSPYTINQIDNIEFSLTHPSIEDLAVILFCPNTHAAFYAVDMNESGVNILNRVVYPNDVPTYYSINTAYYNYGNPVSVNGDWIVYITNYGSNHGYLSEFTITFNF